MKKQILSMSMLVITPLLAQECEYYCDSCNGCSYDCSNECSNDCCQTCCCTNTRPCVDCECYVPQFYNLQCAWGLRLDAEFLYWYAKETNLSYATKYRMIENVAIPAQNMQTSTMTGVANQKQLHTHWDPGFRVGIGFNSCCDGWDYNVIWTWFQNKQRNTTSVPSFSIVTDSNAAVGLGSVGQSILVNPWINQAIGTGFTFNRVKGRYRIRFNQIDLDVGRKYWLSKCFNLRPYVGLRGAWTRVYFSTISSKDFSTTIDMVTDSGSLLLKDRFRTKTWGVGIIGGFQPTWYFSECFALYGEMGGAVLYSDFNVRKKENYNVLLVEMDEPREFIYKNSGRRKFSQLTGVLDLGLGFRWEQTWCCDRYRSALDLGWEHHIYFDQNHRYINLERFQEDVTGVTNSVQASGVTSIVNASGNLGFGGFVLRLHFDF